jgi:hypothetical protein
MDGSRRSGIALVAALALMAVIALLVAGAAAATNLTQRMSRLARTDGSLTSAADLALTTVLADWRQLALADLPLGTPTALDIPIPGAADVHAVVVVTRLPLGILWMVADVSVDADHGHRRVNLVAAFPSLGRRVAAAVTSRGDIQLNTGVTFAADSDSDPECATADGRPIAVAPGAAVIGIDSSSVAISTDALDSATYFLTERQLTALRDGGHLIRVFGDTTIAGGTFDGILIVDGALTISGPYAATGVIVARGPIDATSGGFSLTGALMSYAPTNSGAPTIKFSGVTIRYSLCAVDRALRRTLVPRPVVQRSWAEVF